MENRSSEALITGMGLIRNRKHACKGLKLPRWNMPKCGCFIKRFRQLPVDKVLYGCFRLQHLHVYMYLLYAAHYCSRQIREH